MEKKNLCDPGLGKEFSNVATKTEAIKQEVKEQSQQKLLFSSREDENIFTI